MSRPVVMLLVAASLLAVGCSGSKKKPDVTTPPRPVPSPVATPPATEPGFTLADPSLPALSGATVETGQLGGMTYQIEIPDQWNGRLVLYTHGNDIDTDLRVYPPMNRLWLIEHGYAWASSSYTVNVGYVSGVAADETAALWDYFAQKHGRPQYSYAMGDSMGGAAAFTAAERYADRYDGALPLCADAPPSRAEGDFFYAAAFAAGVTQSEYDASDIGTIIDTRIKPALRDPQTRQRFDALWADLSGGPRPMVAEGVRISYDILWTTAISNVVTGEDGNDGVQYKLEPTAGVSSDDFNGGVIRVKANPGANKYAEGNRISGDIEIPILTVQMTGDAETVFSSSQELRRRVEAKGKGALLVQRAIQSPQHCFKEGMTQREIAASFQALVDWVEGGKKPDGEDLLGDVSNAGAKFTLSPRLGSEAASHVKGADERLTLTGAMTLDGAPFQDAVVFALARNDGMLRLCSYERPDLDAGRYRLTVAADAEAAGCGAPGAVVTLVMFNGERYLSEQTLPWPASPGDAAFNVTFSSANPRGANPSQDAFFGTYFFGTLLDSKGNALGPGTTVEAYSGDARCGAYAVPAVKMMFDDPQDYELSVASAGIVPACAKGATVSFRVNGKETGITALNDLVPEGHPLDLVMP
ncbi:MAG: tannase/feruloyl esterase family alpha/beta hydrolase [Chloroflexota bacterium]|nr:tannase/feruloyl esterase family alpha/beta hydrolase [Chloroflexota bacterium]